MNKKINSKFAIGKSFNLWPVIYDVSKYWKMTEHRFGILVGFTHNITYQTRFENSSGITNHIPGLRHHYITGCCWPDIQCAKITQKIWVKSFKFCSGTRNDMERPGTAPFWYKVAPFCGGLVLMPGHSWPWKWTIKLKIGTVVININQWSARRSNSFVRFGI